jgi:hypothetical protein
VLVLEPHAVKPIAAIKTSDNVKLKYFFIRVVLRGFKISKS